MSGIGAVNRLYESTAELWNHGVEIVVVGDPLGTAFDAALRRLLRSVRDDGPGLLEDLIGAAKSLRWRLLTQPEAGEPSDAHTEAVERVIAEARRLRGSVADETLLTGLTVTSHALLSYDPELVRVLCDSIDEVGGDTCVVVAASTAAQATVSKWLTPKGVTVLTGGQIERTPSSADQTYVLGPPRFFRTSLITAPATGGLTYILPEWFADRMLPKSVIAAYADGSPRIQSHVFFEGVSEPGDLEVDEPVIESETEYLPQPFWGSRSSIDREPAPDEVEAKKLLLSGGLALWLDDGERIRALDPAQPAGERVVYIDVESVIPGTYLLLRRGATERGALLDAALARLSNGAAAEASQRRWKAVLEARLRSLGTRATARQLAASGVSTAERARAWIEPNLVRPHSDDDFERLLQWLDLPVQPFFGHATMLRRALYQASSDIRELLEDAISASDLTSLETDGNLSLDIELEGFRGLLATRVLAISPFSEIVPRHDARIPFTDRSGQWLE